MLLEEVKPGLFGIQYANRNFSLIDTWGKNQFNSSFPASLASYLNSKGLKNIFICLDDTLNIYHDTISTTDLFGVNYTSDDLFFSFETPFTPYQQLLIGNLPRVDLVTQLRSDGRCLRPLEIKLTALPDNTTCALNEEYFSSEIVIRPDTIVYLACSMAANFRSKENHLRTLIGDGFEMIKDWSNGADVLPYLTVMIDAIDRIALSIIDRQTPLVMQPIWKTNGKSSQLSDHCLDVFVWSDLAFTRLFIDIAKGELTESSRITRQMRTIIWLFKMLYDFSIQGQFSHEKIIDELSYNTKNDKAFAVSGIKTHRFLASNELIRPRIRKEEIKNIILGGGQNLLSPERRFDAIIYNSPELFE